MHLLTLYAVIGVSFTLIEAQGRRPCIDLAFLWPLALVTEVCGVVLDNLEAGEL